MVRKSFKFISVITIVVVLPVLSSYPVSDKTRTKRLESLRNEIDRLQNQLQKISEERKSILSKISRLKTLNSLKHKELKEYKIEINSTRTNIEELKARIETLEKEISVLKEYLSERLRQLYKLGDINYLQVFFSAEDSGQMRRNYKYLKIIAKQHHRKLSDFRSSKKELKRKKEKLGEKLDRLKQLKLKAERKSRELSETRKNLEKTLRSIKEDKRKREKALKEFQKAARSLEKLIKGLGEKKKTGTEVPSLEKLKGLLHWPLRGKITLSYGKKEHPKFKTITFHKGLDIKAPLGEKVKTVYDGRVAYADWFEGYGKTVIINHRNNFFTVYAHLSEIEVEKEDFVMTSQKIGKVGESASLKGPHLYFELRKGEKALNPENWLKER